MPVRQRTVVRQIELREFELRVEGIRDRLPAGTGGDLCGRYRFGRQVLHLLDLRGGNVFDGRNEFLPELQQRLLCARGIAEMLWLSDPGVEL